MLLLVLLVLLLPLLPLLLQLPFLVGGASDALRQIVRGGSSKQMLAMTTARNLARR